MTSLTRMLKIIYAIWRCKIAYCITYRGMHHGVPNKHLVAVAPCRESTDAHET